jgi:hypothetical protein
MNTNTKSLLLIFLGAFIVFWAVGEFMLRVLIALFGLGLIFIGVGLRSSNRIQFFIHRVKSKFSDRF